MNSKEIKLLQAQLEVVEAEARILVYGNEALINHAFISQRELSFEEIHEEGVILSYYAYGSSDNILVPWIRNEVGYVPGRS